MLFLTVFIDLLGFGMVLPLLPIYAVQFALGEAHWLIALLMASFSIMQFLFAPMWGRLSDRIGRRPVLMIGLGGSALFYLLFAIATIQESLAWLFVSRIGAGIAGATISTAHAYIADVTPLQSRTRGMALIGAAFGLGFTLGPLFGALALLGDPARPGPGPGYAASLLSLAALTMAYFKLPESLRGSSAHIPHGWMRFAALREALRIPSVGLLLATSFVCVVAFGSFESTLSLVLKSESYGFGLSYLEVLLAFAYVGCILALAQGGLVRPLAKRLSELVLGTVGMLVMVVGLLLLALALQSATTAWLWGALPVCVTGFAFITPALNSLISRRSDPARQGTVLGIAQSVSSLGRIFGPLLGIPLLAVQPLAPMAAGMALLLVALALLWLAAPRGGDYPADA